MNLSMVAEKRISWDRVLIAIAALEFVILFISGVSFSGLTGAVFFDFGVDIFFAFVYATGAPQFVVHYFWLGILLDVSVFVLLLLLYRNTKSYKVAIALFVLTFFFYITLMGFLTHRNYHAGISLVWIPFMFRDIRNREMAYEATRYYLLFFYFSAGLLKLMHNAFSVTTALSANLVNQFKPYYLEGNVGLRTNLNLFLIEHPLVSYLFLLLATMIELACVIGFFTRRFDISLAVLLLSFHAFNWMIMDISPIGQLAFICLLFAGKTFLAEQPRANNIYT